MKKTISSLLLMIVCLGSLAQGDSTYDAYFQQLEEQFKKENFLYRTFNRYEVNPGFSKYSIGASFMPKANGFSGVNEQMGIRMHRGHFEFAYQHQKGIKIEGQDTIKKYNRYAAGYYTPLNFLRFGKRIRDVKGFRFQPTMGIGYLNKQGKHGAYASPGLCLQLPFVIIEGKANVDYAFGRGFEFIPELSLRLDALWNLLDPTVKKVGTGSYTSTTASPLGGGWYRVTSRTTTYDVNMKDVGPFWGIKPIVGYAPAKLGYKKYFTYGLGLSGRASFFGADANYTKGFYKTAVSSHKDVDPIVKDQFDEDRIAGLLSTSEIGIEGSVNVVGLFYSILKPASLSNYSGFITPLNRLSFHLGVNYVSPGSVEYLDENEALTYTNNFFNTHGQVERNAINDPTQFKAAWGVTYGLSYEMGSVGIRLNNKLHKYNGKSGTIDFYYILPITKMVKAYK